MEVELDLWSSRSSDPAVDHILSDLDYCDVPDVDEFILGCSSSGLSANHHLSSSSPQAPTTASPSSTKNDLMGHSHQHHQHQAQYQLPDPSQVLLLFDEPGSEPSLTPAQHHHHHQLAEASPGPANDCCDDLNSQYGALVDQPSSSPCSSSAGPQYASSSQQQPLVSRLNSSQLPAQQVSSGVTCSRQGPSSSTGPLQNQNQRQFLNETLRVDHCYILNSDSNCRPASMGSQHQLKQRHTAQQRQSIAQAAKQQLMQQQQQHQQQVVSSSSVAPTAFARVEGADNAPKVGVSSTTATSGVCPTDTNACSPASNLSQQQQTGVLDLNQLQLLLSTQPQVIPYDAPQHMQFGPVALKQGPAPAAKRRQTGGSAASKRAKAAQSATTNSSANSTSAPKTSQTATTCSRPAKPVKATPAATPHKSRARANARCKSVATAELSQAVAPESGHISPALSSCSPSSVSPVFYASPQSSTNCSPVGGKEAAEVAAKLDSQSTQPTQPPARNTAGKRLTGSRINQLQQQAGTPQPSSEQASVGGPAAKVKGPIKELQQVEKKSPPQEEGPGLSPDRRSSGGGGAGHQQQATNKGETTSELATSPTVSKQQQVKGQLKEPQQTFSLSKLLNQRPTNGFTAASSSLVKQSPCLIINTPSQSYGQFQVQPQAQLPQQVKPARVPSPPVSSQQQRAPATNGASPSSSPCQSVSLPASSTSPSSNQSAVSSSSLPATTHSITSATALPSTSNSYSGTSPSTTCSSSSPSSHSSSSASSSSSSSSSSSMSSTSSSASSSPTMQLGSGPCPSGGAALISNQDWKSAQTGQVVMLTEEERRTLMAEGYPIPQRFPLSKAEERSLKKIRRKIKNKISAQESRRKKKEYMEELEKKVQQMETRMAHLEQENRVLRERAAVDSRAVPMEHPQPQQTGLVTSFPHPTTTDRLPAHNDESTTKTLGTNEHKHEQHSTDGEPSQVAGTGDAASSVSKFTAPSLTIDQRNGHQQQPLESAESTNSQITNQSLGRRKISATSVFSRGQEQLSTDDDYFIDDILMSQETQEGAQQLVNDLVGEDESSSDMSSSDKSASVDVEHRMNFGAAGDEQCSPPTIKTEDLGEPGPVRLLV